MHKPKLIFIQGPRGDEADDGARILKTIPTKTDTTYSIPHIPDVLLMYSCYDGSYSWRCGITGSSFVQCLSKEFKLRAKHDDILTLLTFVNQRISKYFIRLPDNIRDDKRQIGTIVSTLTRVLYLNPVNK